MPIPSVGLPFLEECIFCKGPHLCPLHFCQWGSLLVVNLWEKPSNPPVWNQFLCTENPVINVRFLRRDLARLFSARELLSRYVSSVISRNFPEIFNMWLFDFGSMGSGGGKGNLSSELFRCRASEGSAKEFCLCIRLIYGRCMYVCNPFLAGMERLDESLTSTH